MPVTMGFGTKGPSTNIKIKGAYATMRPIGETCPGGPTGCPIKPDPDNPDGPKCYPMQGYHTRLNHFRSAREAFDVALYIQGLPKSAALRHFVSGDIFANDGEDFDESYAEGMLAGHRKRSDVRGWGYTHGWQRLVPSQVNGPGVCMNASTESDEGTTTALSAGWNVAQMIPTAFTGYREYDTHLLITCPEQINKAKRLQGITTNKISCVDCMLCAKDQRTAKGKPLVIGFEVHSDPKGLVLDVVNKKGEAHAEVPG